MRFRSFLLVMLSLVLAANGAGIESAYAHGHPGATDGAPVSHQEHSMADMDEADCMGDENTTAAHIGEQADNSGHEHSGDGCCKSQSCGCGCVGSSISIVSVRNGVATATAHGLVTPIYVAGYVSPVLPHLVRPPILQAL
jgi:hypothetical protein